MKAWNFKVFISENGDNEIEIWLNGFNKKDQIKFRNVITHLEVQKDMRGPYFGSWSGHAYLYRLKIKLNNRLYRVFGFFGPEENEFTLLIPANKVAGRLDPRNTVEIAEKRYEAIQKDRRHIDDFI